MRKFVPSPSYVTAKPLSQVGTVTNQDMLDAHRKVTNGQRLMKQIRTDLEYGIGNRPSVPSCWEDAEELGHVDPNADMRVSKWDLMADECSMSKRTPEPEPEPEQQPDPTPTE